MLLVPKGFLTFDNSIESNKTYLVGYLSAIAVRVLILPLQF